MSGWSRTSDARLPTLERKLHRQAPIYPAAEIARLANGLTFARDELGPSHPVVVAALGGQEPQARAEALVRNKPSRRCRRFDARSSQGAPRRWRARPIRWCGWRVRSIPLPGRCDSATKTTILGVERPAYAQIAQAMFAMGGADVTRTRRRRCGSRLAPSTDMRRTARLSPPFTWLEGLFARAQIRRERSPYVLPARWRDRA